MMKLCSGPGRVLSPYPEQGGAESLASCMIFGQFGRGRNCAGFRFLTFKLA